jgi:hypothetical protein
MKKRQNIVPVCLSNMVLAQYFRILAGKRHSKATEEDTNKYDMTAVPCLLVVVSHQFAIPI